MSILFVCLFFHWWKQWLSKKFHCYKALAIQQTKTNGSWATHNPGKETVVGPQHDWQQRCAIWKAAVKPTPSLWKKMTQLGRWKPWIIPKIYLDTQPNQQWSGNSLMSQCHSLPIKKSLWWVSFISAPWTFCMQLQVQGLLRDYTTGTCEKQCFNTKWK